jgi:hypothetical protein
MQIQKRIDPSTARGIATFAISYYIARVSQRDGSLKMPILGGKSANKQFV